MLRGRKGRPVVRDARGHDGGDGNQDAPGSDEVLVRGFARPARTECPTQVDCGQAVAGRVSAARQPPAAGCGPPMSRELVLRQPDLFPGAAAVSLPATRPGWRDTPGLLLLIGGLATAICVALDAINAGGEGVVFEDLHVVVSASAASLALLVLARRPGVTILRYGPLSAAVALTALAMATMDLTQPIGATPTALIASVCFVTGSGVVLYVIVPTLASRWDRHTSTAAGLDAGIMLLAGTTVLLTLWRADTNGSAAPLGLLPPLFAAALAASTFMAAVAALAMRAVPTNRGFWFGLPGVAILALDWILWVDLLLHGQGRNGPVSALFSAGILIVSYGWIIWEEEIASTRKYEAAARWLTDWVPMTSILVCAGIGVIPHGEIAGIDPAPVGTAAVVLFAIARQRLLVVNERQASHRLAGEVEERAQTMVSLARLEQAETLEQTAYRICDEALRLVGIDAARVYAFGDASVVPLALEGIGPTNEAIWEPIERSRALHLQACSSAGAWIDTPSDPTSPSVEGLVGEAFAPMRWDDRIIGVVSMGTIDSDNARRLASRFPTLTEFGVVSAALLGPKLAEHWRRADIRSQLGSIIADRAFTPVFQPVVQLQTREIVGFEALTRFRDGTRPDQRFLEADSAGMGVQLETACIGEQLEAATWLPQGTWLSLNVSPALASAVIPLIAALERADRDIVLEITEHVEIADYHELMTALNLIRGKARLAVDDAGAGYAGLHHILELQPQFVKLDISLVRHIDTDPARQAMVAGMAHFASSAGCELIAEGIETEDELGQLIRLGISLGQGYLFGKPGPILTD